MRELSGRKMFTGFLTLLCILLLSTTARAAEITEKNQPAAETSDTQTAEASVEENTPSGEIGPGIKKMEEKTEEPVKTGPVYTQGESLGIFTATAYCPSGSGKGKTYSGTIPQAKHTISADITVLPLGTKVMIDGIIYTVEDVGSSVKGKKVDIFFATRAEALAFGRQSKEVFAVIES